MSQMQQTIINADVSWKAKHSTTNMQYKLQYNSLSFRDIHLRTYPEIFLHSATDTPHIDNVTHVMNIYTRITCIIYHATITNYINKTLVFVFSYYTYSL